METPWSSMGSNKAGRGRGQSLSLGNTTAGRMGHRQGRLPSWSGSLSLQLSHSCPQHHLPSGPKLSLVSLTSSVRATKFPTELSGLLGR